MSRQIAFALFLSMLSLTSYAANNASDNASNSPYNGNSWNNGDNGGNGFGAWSLNPTSNGGAGHFVGNTGDNSHNPSFGIYGTPGNNSFATRSFTGGALTAGQTFSFDMGATPVDTNAQIGLHLLNGSGATVYTFLFTGGQSVWQANDGGSNFNTTLAFFSNTSINFSFTLNSSSNYSVTATESGSTYTCANCTAHADFSNITQFQFFDFGQGNNQNFGFNDLTVVPEVSSVWAGVLASGGVLVFFRRRRPTVA